jgi:hypothetical protein
MVLYPSTAVQLKWRVAGMEGSSDSAAEAAKPPRSEIEPSLPLNIFISFRIVIVCDCFLPQHYTSTEQIQNQDFEKPISSLESSPNDLTRFSEHQKKKTPGSRKLLRYRDWTQELESYLYHLSLHQSLKQRPAKGW